MGPNLLVLMTTEGVRDAFPYFEGSHHGSFTPVIERDSAILGRQHLVRVNLPPGYHENPLRRFP